MLFGSSGRSPRHLRCEGEAGVSQPKLGTTLGPLEPSAWIHHVGF